MIEGDLKTYLGDNVPTAAGVYALIMPQKPTLPALTFTRVSAGRDLTHDGPDDLVAGRFQVDSWATTYAAAKAAAEEVRQALNGFTGTMGSTTIDVARLDSERDLHEPNPALFRVSQDFIIFFKE